MLIKAEREDVVAGYRNIYSYAKESKLECVSQLPYFEGNHWPDLLDNFLKDKQYLYDTNSKKLEKMLNLIKPISKYFFVVKLKSLADGSIKDEDNLVFSDIIDSRDNLLSLSLEKNLDFSILQWAKFSTAVLCYELHLELWLGVIFFCNYSDRLLDETMFASFICEGFELCKMCADIESNLHTLRRYSGKESLLTSAALQEDDIETKYDLALLYIFFHIFFCLLPSPELQYDNTL